MAVGVHLGGAEQFSERRPPVGDVVRPRSARGRRALRLASDAVPGPPVRRLLVRHAASAHVALHPTRSRRRRPVARPADRASAAPVMITNRDDDDDDDDERGQPGRLDLNPIRLGALKLRRPSHNFVTST